MSVRIYQLSKQLQMENKELIALLQSRGLKVESPSNTIPNIYADDLLAEFKDRLASEPAKEEVAKPKKSVEKAEPAHIAEKTETSVATEKPNAVDPVVGPSNPVVAHTKSAPLGKPAPSVVLPPRSAPVLPRPPVALKAATPLEPVAPSTAPVTLAEPEVRVSAPSSPLPSSGIKAPTLPSFNRSPAALPPRPNRLPEKEEPALPSTDQVKRKVICKPPIVVRDFATLLDLKPFRLISELMELGIFASMNQVIEEETAVRLAQRHGVELEVRHRGETQPNVSHKKAEPVAVPVQLEARPPVVCVLGHVDHGKTTLLDTIRRTNVVKGEAGGITQHIGAYQVEHNGHKITFIDTPGHAAFSKMRERGANVTDIAVLVVAADDGFMPQTDEALKFAQKAGVPVVVAINKVDAKGANIDRVKQQLQQRGIASEDWGGETLTAPVSALKGDGMDGLLDSILLQAEMLQLQADCKASASATIVEAQMEQGLGITASAIVKEGTLKAGDSLVCGGAYCRVRSMMNDKGQALKEATAATPIKIIGWTSLPEAGQIARAVKNEKEAKVLADEYVTRRKKEAQVSGQKAPMDVAAMLAALSDQKKVFKVLLKADVHGSVEALEACLLGIKSTKVSLEVVDRSVGLISKNDVVLAGTSGATLIAFNTRWDTGVQAQAKHQGVSLLQHNIIYELIDQVRDAMADLLDPELKEVKVGAAEVRQVFAVSKGTVAGCMVTEGRIVRDFQARVVRKNDVVHEGKLTTLKRFKDDANEVRAGYECGVRLDGFDGYQKGDIIECVQIEKVRSSL